MGPAECPGGGLVKNRLFCLFHRGVVFYEICSFPFFQGMIGPIHPVQELFNRAALGRLVGKTVEGWEIASQNADENTQAVETQFNSAYPRQRQSFPKHEADVAKPCPDWQRP